MKLMASWSRFVLRHVPEPFLREPFALWLALVCMLSAALQFFGLKEPGSIAQLLPTIVIQAWNTELFFGGLLTATGILLNKARILILGLQPLGLAAMAYSVAIIAVTGWRGVFPALIIFAFSQACFIKAFTYSLALTSLSKAKPEEGR